jgi:hypothetical protein
MNSQALFAHICDFKLGAQTLGERLAIRPEGAR